MVNESLSSRRKVVTTERYMFTVCVISSGRRKETRSGEGYRGITKSVSQDVLCQKVREGQNTMLEEEESGIAGSEVVIVDLESLMEFLESSF